MFCCSRIMVGGLALFCLSAFPAGAAKTPAPAAAPLTKEEMASVVRLESFSIPTPGELLAALNKIGKLDWTAKFRPPTATNFRSRAQMALNLGGLIADGYIAVEAQDAQQVRNIGRDIVALAKPLGVQQEIINRGKSLTDFAAENQWDVLKEELEATQNEAKVAMTANKDPNLIMLVTLGGWLRGVEAATSYLAAHYSPEGTKLLRQPAIVHFLNDQLESLPEKLKDEPVLKKMRGKLPEIKKMVSFPSDTVPDREAVEKLNTVVSDLLKDVSRKDSK